MEVNIFIRILDLQYLQDTVSSLYPYPLRNHIMSFPILAIYLLNELLLCIVRTLPALRFPLITLPLFAGNLLDFKTRSR